MSNIRPSQRVLFIDIETSPNVVYTWGIYEQNAIEVIENGQLLCFAYKWQGDKTIKVHSKEELKYKDLLQELHNILDEADVVCGHNLNRFDVRMINSFLIENNFQPTSPYETIDTLKIARSKFRFNSNHLNDLGKYLGLGQKVETGGFKLWKGCMAGKHSDWIKMRRYNKNDVALLEKVYDKLAPWANRTPINSFGMFCPNCGSDNLIKRGFTDKNTSSIQRYVCGDCGKWSQSNYKIKRKIGEYLK